MTFTWPLECAKVNCKYANRKPKHDLQSDDNSNFDSVCHHFEDIYRRNVHNVDLALRMGQGQRYMLESLRVNVYLSYGQSVCLLVGGYC